MNKHKLGIEKHILGLCAILFLIVGALLSNADILELESREFISGTLLKVGFVLALVWIAAPQLERLGWERLRGTLLLALVIVLILIVIRPRIGAAAAAIFAAGALAFSLLGWIRKLGSKRE